MSEQICYKCVRKENCYPKCELNKLQPDKTFQEMSGYECGALYRDFEEAQVFIRTFGDVIANLGKRTQKKIIKEIAEKYNSTEYFVALELFDY